MYGYTYLITNLINGHQYVGQHKYDKPELDPYYFGSGELLKKKIKQYGKENFSIELLELCDNEDELNDAEIRGIAEYKTFVDWGYGGYNLTTGGGGGTPSKESIEKTRIKQLNNPLKSKTILQYDLDGNFITEYISAHYAQRMLNIKASNICECCNKKRKTAGGYIWKFKEVC